MAPPSSPPNNDIRNVYATQPLDIGNIRGTGAEQAIADIDQFRGGAIIVQHDAQPVHRTAQNTPSLPSRHVLADMLADLIDYDLTHGLPETFDQLRDALERTVAVMGVDEPY
ncbi:hypothetical protein B0A48_08048 [Cryoendolithus antarcticus]|uniref:Uncharacterized protein n=1 Tax=Cryoendolithus antarcticus TaxID=1507870 RepID=A0A1V8T1D3_9PEZI|nr:hypothetical protein B0A48_08048 [Cryoendolithus antarcticus]